MTQSRQSSSSSATKGKIAYEERAAIDTSYLGARPYWLVLPSGIVYFGSDRLYNDKICRDDELLTLGDDGTLLKYTKFQARPPNQNVLTECGPMMGARGFGLMQAFCRHGNEDPIYLTVWGKGVLALAVPVCCSLDEHR
ncbi:hypothetical protein PG996_014224 [Apiospora saccharicola]|uniref:Uncharacterized protein n=1 Tax=Apiospora saccharicola TaxID=335842 RepID=A0ABR1TJQ9_9PEZI